MIGGIKYKMFEVIEYKDIDEKCVLIDVRSPGEFKEATIPNAINIPLFTDEERHNIGYIYVNESIEKAKRLGIEVVAKKLPQIYDSINEAYKRESKLVFFCAKGGMRSSSITNLVKTLGMNAFKLKGGYKGYRSFVNEQLPLNNEKVTYVVLRGKTGIGKTKILNELENRGFDVLDLEGAANHRGSLLGNVGLGNMNSQKQFESIVLDSLMNRKSNMVFVEGESKRIGHIIIPDYIYSSMVNGITISCDAHIEYRKKVIVDEYTKNSNFKEEILLCLEKLKRYISDVNIEMYKEMIEKGKYEEVAEMLMLKYYDPSYANSLKKYGSQFDLYIESVESACDILSKFIENKIKEDNLV